MTGGPTADHSKSGHSKPPRPRPARREPTSKVPASDTVPSAGTASDSDGMDAGPGHARSPRGQLTDDLAYQVWLELRTDAQNTTPHRRGRTPGQLWSGSLDTVIARTMAAATGRSTGEVRGAPVLTTLTTRGAIAVTNEGIWVADQWPTTTPVPASDVTPPKPAPPPSPRSTQKPRPGGHRCGECAYVGLTPQALARHSSSFAGRLHPTASYPCPHPECPAVAVLPESAKYHRDISHPGEITRPREQQTGENSGRGPTPSTGSGTAGMAAASDPYANLRQLLAGNDEAIHHLEEAIAASEQTTASLKMALKRLTG